MSCECTARKQFMMANPRRMYVSIPYQYAFQLGATASGSSDPGIIDPVDLITDAQFDQLDEYMKALEQCGLNDAMQTTALQDLYIEMGKQVEKYGPTAQATQAAIEVWGTNARAICEQGCEEGACPTWAPAAKRKPAGGSTAGSGQAGSGDGSSFTILPQSFGGAIGHSAVSGVAGVVLGVVTFASAKKHPVGAVFAGVGSIAAIGWSGYTGYRAYQLRPQE